MLLGNLFSLGAQNYQKQEHAAVYMSGNGKGHVFWADCWRAIAVKTRRPRTSRRYAGCYARSATPKRSSTAQKCRHRVSAGV